MPRVKSVPLQGLPGKRQYKPNKYTIQHSAHRRECDTVFCDNVADLVLPCSHIFCYECLDGIRNANDTNVDYHRNNPGYPPEVEFAFHAPRDNMCPNCRREIPLHTPRRTLPDFRPMHIAIARNAVVAALHPQYEEGERANLTEDGVDLGVHIFHDGQWVPEAEYYAVPDFLED